MRRTWKTTAIAAVAAIGVFAVAPALGQIRVGSRTGGISSGSTVGRGVIKQNNAESQRQALQKACEFYLGKAEGYHGQKRYALACQKLRQAKGLLVSRALAERWGALGKKLNEAGNAEIAKGDEAFEKQEYAKAKKIYKQAWLVFAGLPASRTAQQRLSDAKADPDVESVESEARAAKVFKLVRGVLERYRGRQAAKHRAALKAATQPASAPSPRRLSDIEVIRALADGSFLRVAELLQRIASEHAATPTGQEAAGLFQTLNEDAVYKQRLERLRAGERAAKDLAMANAYCDAGLLTKAEGMYKDVIKKYPDTPQAKEAARQLGVIEATISKP